MVVIASFLYIAIEATTTFRSLLKDVLGCSIADKKLPAPDSHGEQAGQLR